MRPTAPTLLLQQQLHAEKQFVPAVVHCPVQRARAANGDGRPRLLSGVPLTQVELNWEALGGGEEAKVALQPACSFTSRRPPLDNSVVVVVPFPIGRCLATREMLRCRTGNLEVERASETPTRTSAVYLVYPGRPARQWTETRREPLLRRAVLA
jgi:hypothetical protein